jgi:hypothetical protein
VAVWLAMVTWAPWSGVKISAQARHFSSPQHPDQLCNSLSLVLDGYNTSLPQSKSSLVMRLTSYLHPVPRLWWVQQYLSSTYTPSWHVQGQIYLCIICIHLQSCYDWTTQHINTETWTTWNSNGQQSHGGLTCYQLYLLAIYVLLPQWSWLYLECMTLHLCILPYDTQRFAEDFIFFSSCCILPILAGLWAMAAAIDFDSLFYSIR